MEVKEKENSTDEENVVRARAHESALYASDWITNNHILNEKGEPMTWDTHLFLKEIYDDQSQFLVVMKAAQVGASIMEVLKNIRDAYSVKMDIIYTLPSDSDVNVFVGGKVNRVIANNKVIMEMVSDKDSIEQKAIGPSMLYFRGTWTPKSAIMVTADRLVHDEVDTSKSPVIADYQSRIQHSKYKQIHVFSHPSLPGQGVDSYWVESDQKEWMIRCRACGREQYLSWNISDPKKMSIDISQKEFVCKHCHASLTWQDRALGRWARRKGKEHAKWSGYHISLLMAPWVSAAEVVDKYNDVLAGKQTMDYFYNKVLGLPYAGIGNTISEDTILGCWMPERPPLAGRIVVGLDTGLPLYYVYGDLQGLIGYGKMKDYMPDSVNKLPLNQTVEYFLRSFDDSVVLVDQGGDLIGSRKLQQKYPGRVILCYYQRDRQTENLVRWGTGDEGRTVKIDRNRMIGFIRDEFQDRRMRLLGGTKDEWRDYWNHWSNIFRRVETNELGVNEFRWDRSGPDHLVHATVYWRAGMMRFGQKGGIANPGVNLNPDSYVVNPNQTVGFNPDELFGAGRKVEKGDAWWTHDEEDDGDWRSV